MKKIFLFVSLVTFIFSGTICAKMMEMQKENSGLTVKLIMEMQKHNEDKHHKSDSEMHHAMGANTIDIIVTDSENRTVSDAKIKVNYSMPPSGNMPPMKYTARARQEDEKYHATLNFSMKGQWDVLVYVKRPGEPLAKFEFDVHVE